MAQLWDALMQHPELLRTLQQGQTASRPPVFQGMPPMQGRPPVFEGMPPLEDRPRVFDQQGPSPGLRRPDFPQQGPSPEMLRQMQMKGLGQQGPSPELLRQLQQRGLLGNIGALFSDQSPAPNYNLWPRQNDPTDAIERRVPQINDRNVIQPNDTMREYFEPQFRLKENI
jgi:hypothetical protein